MKQIYTTCTMQTFRSRIECCRAPCFCKTGSRRGLQPSSCVPLTSTSTHARPRNCTTKSFKPVGHAWWQERARSPQRYERLKIRAGLLSRFLPSRRPTDTTVLVNELLDIASSTDGGASASQDQRTRIRALVRTVSEATLMLPVTARSTPTMLG